ncbi:hypothetical protein PIB30_109119, partial [Stylosanthes scabra]|nr:hypothetical protein [Stylosanthes scabra]
KNRLKSQKDEGWKLSFGTQPGPHAYAWKSAKSHAYAWHATTMSALELSDHAYAGTSLSHPCICVESYHIT